MGRENKTERCGEWEGRTKQRDVLSGMVEQKERCGEWEGRTKLRDVVCGKGEQNIEMW